VPRAVPYVPRNGPLVRPPFVRSLAPPRRCRRSIGCGQARTSPIKGLLPLCLARQAASRSCAPPALAIGVHRGEAQEPNRPRPSAAHEPS
jgi:hypothetical protein